MCLETTNENASPAASKPAAAANSASAPIVLKFGSSVLRDVSDLKHVVTEIYRFARRGRKVVAVVSAFAGETDKLYAEASALGAASQSRHAPRLIALGEDRSAALLAIACDVVGLDARIAGARQLSLRAGGPVDDAHPQSIDEKALRQALLEHDVVIVPGFVAISASGEPVLLGRGGSDLTAVCVADALRLEEVSLIKDVDGVYDRDPAIAGADARRFRFLDWSAARDVAGKLLQPKSIDFAASRGVAVNVRELSAAEGTRVAARNEDPAPVTATAPVRVAVAGLGVIGAEAAGRVLDSGDVFSLSGILVRRPEIQRDQLFAHQKFVGAPDDIFETRPHLVIDALPSEKTGRELIQSALLRGVSVVSANKQAVAGSLAHFHGLAKKNGATLNYNAAVGGGAPMIETVRRAAAEGSIKSVTTILNGTVNFILSAMRDGQSFDDAIAQAQAAGFAEPDPSADLSGEDAKAKISILCFEAFGAEPARDLIAVEPLTRELAEKMAVSLEPWKQLAAISVTSDGVPTASVEYRPVGDDPLFTRTQEEENALRVELDDGRRFQCRGKGAGRRPTVESLLADSHDFRRSVLSANRF